MSSLPAPADVDLDRLGAEWERSRDPDILLAFRSQAVDRMVAAAAREHLLLRDAPPLALVAVGGYGRSELFPCSDIDLLVTALQESDLSTIKGSLDAFLGTLWDRGLRVSHSTRTVAECSRFQKDNIELHISLLDRRYVAGDHAVFALLSRKASETGERHAPEMIGRLVAMAEQRHRKYNNTPYHLEPNVKESPGGVRDVHLLRWLAQLEPGQRFLEESFSDVHSNAARLCLFSTRVFLHLRAGRDANLLTFEMQDEAARALLPEPVTPEQWMREYLKNARRIFQRSLRALEFAGSKAGAQNRALIQALRATGSRVSTPDHLVLNNRIHVRDIGGLLLSSERLLGLFSFAGAHGLQLSPETQWRLQQEAERVSTAFECDPPGWNRWSELFDQPHAAVALAEMAETGVLTAALPQWSRIDSLVIRDFYHRYTVDEHTLVALQELDRLAGKQKKSDRFAGLVREEGSLVELRLALLLHDVGKGTAPEDHVRGSQAVAAEVMDVLGTPAASRQTVQFLIEHHLDLSAVMNGRDLEDPATARYLTAEIDTAEKLRRLTLLTFVDISAVNPTAMSPWRAEQLWRVYTLGIEQLTRELTSNRIHPYSGEFAANASPELREFLDGLPKRYIRIHRREQIDHHLSLAAQSRRDGVAVEIVRESGAYLMTVVTHDKSGLFAALCGTLASFGMNIVKGEAYANATRSVLDLIRFTDPNDTLALNPEEVHRLEETVTAVVRGLVQVAELLKRRRPLRRPTSEAAILPSVRFNDSASDEATLIDFAGEDRPGLLHDLASVISSAGCNIEVVMIDTEAHKAIDVFYVTSNGRKLDGEEQSELGAKLLAAAGAADPNRAL